MTATGGSSRKKLALVYGNLPTVEEIDQFRLLADQYEISVISSESVCGYLTQTSWFQDLACVALPDHDENPTYLPGLEKALAGYDLVVVKERLGMYAYQAVKAKWRHRFRLIVWVDNATPMPGEDVKMMRTVRVEVSNAADAFLVQSESARQALLVEGVEPQRLISFAPWVEARAPRGGKARAKAVATLGLADTDYIIAHFGQIEWEEGLLDLVHALKLLQTQEKSLGARVKLVFCGIGSFSTELRDRLVALGLDRQAVYVAPGRDAYTTVLSAANCLYYAPFPARDRLEAEPFRIVGAIAHKIPLLSPRNPLVEEFAGKHRHDFCAGSAESLAKAIRKAAGAAGLSADIANKAAGDARTLKAKVAREMAEAVAQVVRQPATVDVSALDHQVLEIETLVHSKQYLAAIDLIESVFKHADIPTHHRANLYRLIGDCFAKLGDPDAAKNAYLQAVELDPYGFKSYIGLGTVALVKRNPDIAVPHFQKAVSLAPNDEMANLGLGLAFQGLSENNEACRWVVKALELNPENTAALYTLVQVADARGRFEEADAALTRYLEAHPHDHNFLYTLAAIRHRAGRDNDALALIERLQAQDPGNERAVQLAAQVKHSLAAVSGAGG